MASLVRLDLSRVEVLRLLRRAEYDQDAASIASALVRTPTGGVLMVRPDEVATSHLHTKMRSDLLRISDQEVSCYV